MPPLPPVLKRFPYTDILGWSVSRYDRFSSCMRQYFYDYYPKYDKEVPFAKLQSLKKMTSVALEAGNVVHDVIKMLLERLLTSEKPVDKERFIAFARKKTEEYCSQKTFSEVYYKTFTGNPYEKVFLIVEKGLNNFLSSERYSWIVSKAVSNKTGWVIEPPGFGETRINGLKAYCKVDFLFPVEDKIYILDWKTGKPDEIKHKKQLIGYSTWASYHFGTDASKIMPLVAYLQPQYSELEVTISEGDVTGFTEAVKQETKEMYSCLTDIEKNIPKPKEVFVKSESKLCSYCNYRELCGK